jgi:hypothetical protein
VLIIKGYMNMMHGIYSVKTPDWLDRVAEGLCDVIGVVWGVGYLLDCL